MIDMTAISTRIAALITDRFESNLALTSDCIANHKDYPHQIAAVKGFDGANPRDRADKSVQTLRNVLKQCNRGDLSTKIVVPYDDY